MSFATFYILSSVLTGLFAESQGYHGTWHGFVSLLLTPVGGAISIYYTHASEKEDYGESGQSKIEGVKKIKNRDIHCPHIQKSKMGYVRAKSEDKVHRRCFEEFKKWFDIQKEKYTRESNNEVYFPPIVLFTRKEKDVYVGKMMRMDEKTGVDDFEKLLAASFLVGERASKGVSPLSFTILLDGRLVGGSNQKVFVFTSLRSGQKEFSSARILNKDEHARASPALKNAGTEAGIMPYVANAFWTGTGAGARHKVPRISLTYNPTSTNPEIPRYQALTGSVYVLSNPALTELVKVGYTTRCAQVRASELSDAGVPGKWEVTCEIGTNRPEQVKEEVHSRLSHHRHRSEGQFLEVGPRKAARVVKSAAGDYVRIALRK